MVEHARKLCVIVALAWNAQSEYQSYGKPRAEYKQKRDRCVFHLPVAVRKPAKAHDKSYYR